jgi:hypothetical protein
MSIHNLINLIKIKIKIKLLKKLKKYYFKLIYFNLSTYN